MALERDRPHRPLNRVVVDVDPAIVEEPDEPGPVAQRIVDRLEGRRAAEHAPALGVEPAMQLVDDRPGSRLADGKALFGHVAIDLALDAVEQSDPVQRFGGDRRAIALAASVEEAAANMRPATGQHGGSAGTACLAELESGTATWRER